jgi:hypothetical protein
MGVTIEQDEGHLRVMRITGDGSRSEFLPIQKRSRNSWAA